ncbi:CoA transferase [Sphaerisporangium rubeum]|uniref:Crotonobetainyl-CoA:carnitine CoA-transferase CaiB-like acyl-CoA transferase n=1 Tax=Sphaerisporangium rubeum TaxID=321317 RepID=A0A7X0M6K6_9ACTN|nr:CoA transferase [Sphaerisporangium rubeum]MBB6473342.1 crotonobetainyl-CoA:carnitine CoA-transferase CaiB-like acyl-CoA transferase [Sphaerisporangium rubeum]
MDATPPLTGIRVLDLASELTAYGTRLLAGLGADVLVVEPPGGHELRRRPPFPTGTSSAYGLPFAYLFTGKRAVTLDVTVPAALPLLTDLARDADVVIASPGPLSPIAGLTANPGTVDAGPGDADTVVTSPAPHSPVAGLDPARPALSWAPRDAIVCLVTPFGLTGPYRSYRATHLTLHAMSGGMHTQGPVEGPPVVIPGEQKYAEVGAWLAVAVLAALRERGRSGGQVLDLSAHEVMTATDGSLAHYTATGHLTGRGPAPGTPPSGVWRCRDGDVEFQVWTDRHWHGFVELIGSPEALRDPALAHPAARAPRAAELTAVIEPLVGAANRGDLVREGQRLGVPCGPINTIGEFAEDEQVRARGGVTDTSGLPMPAWPFRATVPLFTEHPRRAPLTGEHNDEEYIDRLGHDANEPAEWQEAGLV